VRVSSETYATSAEKELPCCNNASSHLKKTKREKNPQTLAASGTIAAEERCATSIAEERR
jgi:hypothetical protein